MAHADEATTDLYLKGERKIKTPARLGLHGGACPLDPRADDRGGVMKILARLRRYNPRSVDEPMHRGDGSRPGEKR
jgi:hypothetical protein